jgi:hypothetical protein
MPDNWAVSSVVRARSAITVSAGENMAGTPATWPGEADAAAAHSTVVTASWVRCSVLRSSRPTRTPRRRCWV